MTSIIIINYHSQQLICDSLQSFFDYHTIENIEIIIVNNGGTLTDLQARFYGEISLKIIDSNGNVGFSKANNLGVQHATGDYLLFLNADTLFIEPIVGVLVEQLSKHPEVGIVAPRLLNVDLSLQQSYHDGHRVFRKLWRRNPLAIKWFSSERVIKMDDRAITNAHEHVHAAPWLSGACMMLRRSDVIDKKWYWDEDFFMYWEDVELCYRIRRSGFIVRYFPGVKLVHIGGSGEANVSLSRFTWMENAKLLFIQKTKGNIYKCVYWIWMKWELRLERFLERRKGNAPQNTLLAKEIDFYLMQKK